MTKKIDVRTAAAHSAEAATGAESTRLFHDLNQPLNSIKMISGGIMYLLNQGKRISDEELAGCMKEIVSQTDAVAEIIKKLKS